MIGTSRLLLRETILGFTFWSLFQGLGPMIWFYPLNELEISGYEAYAAFWFMPIITAFGFVFRLIQNRWFLGVLRLIVAASVASFQAPTTLNRLVVLAVGNGAAMLVFTATFWSRSNVQRTTSLWSLMLGFIGVLVGRIWYTTFIPTWWNNHSNSVVLTLSLIATLDKIISGDDAPKDDRPVKQRQSYWIFTGLGFGSLLYLTHWVFGEVSLVSRWLVTGYPDPGPQPYPYGLGILFAICFGVCFIPRSYAQSKVWWLFGALSFAALYYLPSWQAYAGGAVLGVYTMSIWPEMIERLSGCPPTRTIVLSIAVYLVEIFFWVWTVAYNFVPGGVYTREHTDYLIAIVMLSIALGLFTSKITVKEDRSEKVKKVVSGARTGIFLMFLIGVAGFGMRHKAQVKNHTSENPRQFSAAIWTYHFGYDNQGWPSLDRSASLLKATGADFITLLESDASKPFLGNNDLGMWLGEKLGMYVDFGPATKDHTWGNLILSKYPIVKSKHHLLPSPHGELAPAITATVNFTGNLVDFVVTHMGNDRDVLDRKLQAEFLSDELKNTENPAVFLGYVTSAPFSRDYKKLTSNGVKDIDSTDRDRWCEYIMYKDLIRLGYARISHGGLSDTEVQMAKFHIPENRKNYKDNSKLTTDPSKVNSKLHFNARFGEYKEGHHYPYTHHYHMSTPKYFLP
ncbi:PGAP2-interacting protein-like [Tubulanus polymorphus]|uniref:PGAP2-interacting protein-like n=1 Tax=Tubulanus polymorphus TaxID=672921 RepID=UPI003DA43676